MLNLFANFAPSFSPTKFDAMLRQIVEASAEDVTTLVADRVENMTLSEARGYVRARANSIVQRQVRIMLAGQPIADVVQIDLARAAIERLVPVVMKRAGVGLPRTTALRLAA